MSSPAPSWGRWFSPRPTFGQVPVAEVRQALRGALARWGRPGCLRVDNGTPWGNWNDLPTPFALWVLGCGIGLHWNDAGCPQQNPKVERSQGTAKRWGEPERCRRAAELQANLDEADRIQREEYPGRGGLPRLAAFPGLAHAGRPYTPAWEQRHWDLGPVEAHLAEYVAVRRVGASGHVTVYDHGRWVGAQYRGQDVLVQYDPQRHEWLIADRQGRELRRHPAPEISRAAIMKLSFRKPRRPPAGCG
jgi:hypothetical protein